MHFLPSFRVPVLCLLALASLASGCTSEKKEVWVYTSIYKSVIEELEPQLKKEFPDIDVRWFQGGSEIVAGKVNAELAAGGSKADLILTSDPFWYLELKENGQLIPYESPAAAKVPPELRDPGHAFVTVRIPVMVLAYNSEKMQPNALPAKFSDLAEPRFKEKVSMGSPLESGTNFTAAAFLSDKLGWEYFGKLRKQGLIAAGGNSSVTTRIETGERPVGILLLENILAAMAKGSPVRPVYPLDGSIPIPSPIAILKREGQDLEATKRIYDWFFGTPAQNAIVKSGMYSPLPEIVHPDGARPWAELKTQMMPWTPEILRATLARREEVKKRFSEIVLQ